VPLGLPETTRISLNLQERKNLFKNLFKGTVRRARR
jgi:hypothetical protein